MPRTPAHRNLSELMPLQIAQDLGYLVVLENIDPQDWAKPGADMIVQRVKQQRRDGSIILLHDAGGDRSQTVEALAAHSGLSQDARRHCRLVKHAPGNDAR